MLQRKPSPCLETARRGRTGHRPPQQRHSSAPSSASAPCDRDPTSSSPPSQASSLHKCLHARRSTGPLDMQRAPAFDKEPPPTPLRALRLKGRCGSRPAAAAAARHVDTSFHPSQPTQAGPPGSLGRRASITGRRINRRAPRRTLSASVVSWLTSISVSTPFSRLRRCPCRICARHTGSATPALHPGARPRLWASPGPPHHAAPPAHLEHLHALEGRQRVPVARHGGGRALLPRPARPPAPAGGARPASRRLRGPPRPRAPRPPARPRPAPGVAPPAPRGRGGGGGGAGGCGGGGVRGGGGNGGRRAFGAVPGTESAVRRWGTEKCPGNIPGPRKWFPRGAGGAGGAVLGSSGARPAGKLAGRGASRKWFPGGLARPGAGF